MSAYMVEEEHINVMIWAAERYGEKYHPLRWYYGNSTSVGILEDIDAVGQMLIDANTKSVNHRYNKRIASPTYRYRQPRQIGWSVGELLHAIDGYEYQACEPRDWRDSEALAFCQALRNRLIKHVAGYQKGPWTIATDDKPLASQANDTAVAG